MSRRDCATKQGALGAWSQVPLHIWVVLSQTDIKSGRLPCVIMRQLLACLLVALLVLPTAFSQSDQMPLSGTCKTERPQKPRETLVLQSPA